MAIPKNITKDHLLQAISKIDREGIPKDGRSQYYDVSFKGQKYPPKLVVSYANIFANGEELSRTTFSGGEGTPCFRLLERNGFTIEEKDELSYYQELREFLDQADTDGLKTSKYIKRYRGLNVSVSFGKGNQSRIPWIAFLDSVNSVQKGIYPVYLYYKKQRLLVLAYGVSETNTPSNKWENPKETIREYFRKQNLGNPPRYGNSYVFRAYNVAEGLNEIEVNQDLNELIGLFKKTMNNKPSRPKKEDPFDHDKFIKNTDDAGLIFNNNLIVRFASSLLTKPFVILTGLSGSGKTKLAQSFAQWICEEKNQYCLVPVGADWTNREPLLGYPNALNPGEYVKPDSKVLDLLIRAESDQERPYYLILDEMNLSHVERYFADFLSVMESGGSIPLYAEGEVINGVPADLRLPSNVFIIGTVNIDETTNMFSPKVLDRANTIEFRISESDLKGFLNNHKEIDMGALQSKGAGMARSFVEMAKDSATATGDIEEIKTTLIRFFGQLKKAGAEFGYRSTSEIVRLIQNLTRLDSEMRLDEKLDIAIMQKLLPKLHGSRRKLVGVLTTLAEFCVTEKIENVEKEVFNAEEFDFLDLEKVKFPLSLEKIARMHKAAIDNGFTSFAEA